ncbi:hypothetical protein PAP_01080 [Palaeococcus pacificus DY20341]|uniref:MEDS domain-containing protein n=1 Tax=Palaeococcus pacificus DY20341 TaxID=1343739 RepID=A0A075LW37_9EURY|nr:DUF257 family protein [Palaeococcus pacificus]AIF68658.1 hypothetical protein PAP_01080 [Palaeococcus pacificus DY20341]
MICNELELIFSNLKPGETVLIEYDSISSPELLLYIISRYCEKRGIQVIIDDIGDTLAEFITRLEIIGLPTDKLLKTDVIKIGGYRKLGNVVDRVEIDKYTLDFKYYGKIYDKWRANENISFNPVLGIHKLFLVAENNEAIRLVRNISTFVGNKTRIALYFINKQSMERRNPEIVPLLEEVATSVLEWKKTCRGTMLRVLKAPSEEICEKTVELSIEELREY